MTTKSQQVAAIINAFGFLPGHVFFVSSSDLGGVSLSWTTNIRKRAWFISRERLDALRDEISAVGASVATIRKGIAKADGFAKHDRLRACFVKLSAEEQARRRARRAARQA